MVQYLPTSNAGDAIGLSSVVIVKMPSNLRSSSGLVTSAEIWTRTLEWVSKERTLRMREAPCLA
jgi:hypothetical protein